MSPIVYAVPYTPPAPPAALWTGLDLRWESPDGSVWPLCGDTADGVLMQAGVRGLTEPKRETFTTETAGTDGALWMGSRALPREVFWPIVVWKDTTSAQWLDYDAAWWRSLDPQAPGRWVATHPSGAERHLLCRFVGDGDASWDVSPGSRGWARYGVTMLATDPYWRGEQVARSWSGAADPSETFTGDGGPPFTISAGSTLASAEVTNDGDVPAHPTWWVQDVSSVNLSVGSGVIEVPAVAADRLLVIDSHPSALSAFEVDAPPAISAATGEPITDAEREAWVDARLPSGLDRTADLGMGTTWGAIPARATTPLGISMVGDGTVSVRFTPRFRRAW